MNNEVKKAVAYIRVSTEEQVKNGQGLEIQKQKIQDYVEANDIHLAHVFEDAGISGANDIEKRKGLKDLLDYVYRNQVDYVLVSQMDRLARDVYIQLWLEKELKKTCTQIISIGEDNLNGDDYMTTAMRQIVGVFAQLEKSRIANRMDSGRRKRAEMGRKASGNCPYGYKYNSNSQVETVARQKKVVQTIFSDYMKGLGFQKIANKLNEQGYTSQRGKAWTRQSIRNILKNDFYTGQMRYNEITIEGCHEAIMNKITYGKVQAKMKKNEKVLKTT